MKPNNVAFGIAIVVATCAFLYQTPLITAIGGWYHYQKDTGDQNCAWQRHECAEDCSRYDLFHGTSWPVAADAWDNSTTVPSDKRVRSSLYRVGARVVCWPSTGGIWIKHALPLDMSFLGLSIRYNTLRPAEPDPVEEDAFCTKLRLVGAEFWQKPPNLTECASLEECVKPHIRNDLGMAWVHGKEKGLGGAHLVNLTAAKIQKKLGPGMWGYFQAPDVESRVSVSYYLDGVWCPEEPETCRRLWCAQYPTHCNEAYHLINDDMLWKCEKRIRGFW